MVPWVKSASGEMDAVRAFSQFDIDKDPPRLEELRQILDATDPDLSAFRKHGGKLLMYFGWADPQLNAKMGVEYYEQVVDKMGPSTGEFFRLFMVPGMFHCGGGVGTSQFDMTTPRGEVGGSGHGAGSYRGQPRDRGQGGAHAAALRVSANGAVQGHGQHRRSGELHLREADRVSEIARVEFLE